MVIGGKTLLPRVFVSMIREDQEQVLTEGLNYIQWHKIINSNSRVFIKPNLTFPIYKPGVTTSPGIIEALVRILKERTNYIMIGESDGGYHSHKAEEAFKGHNFFEISNKYGVKLVNLSEMESEIISFSKWNKKKTIPLPKVLLYDIDVFITVPVLKVHSLTRVSLSFKNQWGCVPDMMRILYHDVFNEAILEINRRISPAIAIVDGTYGLTRSGPIDGDPIRLDLVLVSDDIGAADATCCDIMGVPITSVKHLSLAKENDMLPSLRKVRFNKDFSEYRIDAFYLKKTFWSWAALQTWKHRIMLKLVYDSPISAALHWIMYLFRKKIEKPNQ